MSLSRTDCERPGDKRHLASESATILQVGQRHHTARRGHPVPAPTFTQPDSTAVVMESAGRG